MSRTGSGKPMRREPARRTRAVKPMHALAVHGRVELRVEVLRREGFAASDKASQELSEAPRDADRRAR